MLAALSGALLTACGSSPKASFYTLGPDPTLAPLTPSKPANVVVSPVTVPDLLDRPQIVTRRGDNQVTLDEFARWGQPLKGDIARAIAGNLTTLLGSDRVSIFDTGLDAARTWRVRVDVIRFDAVPSESVTIEALWTVLPPGKAAPVAGKSLVRQEMTTPGFDGLVSAGDRALGAVSREIAAAIQTSAPQ
jgi:uncharacterized lipoprotein YmbA